MATECERPTAAVKSPKSCTDSTWRAPFVHFTRCMACNGALEPVSKEEAQNLVPERSFERYKEFHRCEQCGRIYWKGSHYARMRRWVEELAHK